MGFLIKPFPNITPGTLGVIELTQSDTARDGRFDTCSLASLNCVAFSASDTARLIGPMNPYNRPDTVCEVAGDRDAGGEEGEEPGAGIQVGVYCLHRKGGQWSVESSNFDTEVHLVLVCIHL